LTRQAKAKGATNAGDDFMLAPLPWIEKMRPKDRLLIRASSARLRGQPNLPMLQWKYAVNNLWIGRLPAKAK
jgi:hypothetical protein